MTRDEHAFADILQQAIGLGPLPMAVAHPCSREALLGAVEAADHGIATPILVAPPPGWPNWPTNWKWT